MPNYNSQTCSKMNYSKLNYCKHLTSYKKTDRHINLILHIGAQRFRVKLDICVSHFSFHWVLCYFLAEVLKCQRRQQKVI